jgi:chromosome segregation ATPase
MADDSERLTQAVESAKQNVAGLEGSLKKISTEYNKLKEEVAKIQDAENNLLEEIGKTQKELTNSKTEAKSWEQKANVVRQEYASQWKELMDLKRTTAAAALSANKHSPADDTNSESIHQIEIDQLIGAEVSEELPIFESEVLDNHKTEELKRSISALEAEREK